MKQLILFIGPYAGGEGVQMYELQIKPYCTLDEQNEV